MNPKDLIRLIKFHENEIWKFRVEQHRLKIEKEIFKDLKKRKIKPTPYNIRMLAKEKLKKLKESL